MLRASAHLGDFARVCGGRRGPGAEGATEAVHRDIGAAEQDQYPPQRHMAEPIPAISFIRFNKSFNSCGFRALAPKRSK
jgi:hypothetical protein